MGCSQDGLWKPGICWRCTQYLHRRHDINDGTLVLNKGTGAGGINALTGKIFVGGDSNSNSIQSGFSGSDILRLAQPHQIPDWLAPIDIRPTGRFELAGNNETIGNADAQNALTLRASSSVDLDGATLTVNGNINTNAGELATLWTPIAATRIVNGTLNIGALTRTLDVPDRAELPFELEISAKLQGTAGYLFTNSGTLLLTGDNSGLSGEIVRTNGNFAVGHDQAFGAARVLMSSGKAHITTYGGKRTLSNEFWFNTDTRFIGGNATANSANVGGGGNDLTFTGAVNITASTWVPTIAVAGQVEFAGGIGEAFGNVAVSKRGFGTMVFSSPVTLGGGLTIGQDGGDSPGNTRLNGGSVILRGAGSLLNSNVTIGYGGQLEVINSSQTNRFHDSAIIDLAGGTLALIAAPGATAGEIFGQLRVRNNNTYSQVHSIVQAGAAANWRFSTVALEGANTGSNVKFVGRGQDISATGNNRIAFTSRPTLANGILAYGVLQGGAGLDFAGVVTPDPLAIFDNYLSPLTSGPNFSNTLVGATTTTNVKLSGSESVGSSVTAGALLLANGQIVSGLGALTLSSGLLVSSGSNTVSVASLTLGAAEGIVFNDRDTLTFSANIVGGATSSLGYSGTGTTIVSGNNTIAGTVRVTGGTVRHDHRQRPRFGHQCCPSDLRRVA